MPSTSQNAATDTEEEYDTEAERFVDTKPKHMVLSIRPMSEENTREWIGACNQYGDTDMVEHFIDELDRMR